jgi:hypothetical protein
MMRACVVVMGGVRRELQQSPHKLNKSSECLLGGMNPQATRTHRV